MNVSSSTPLGARSAGGLRLPLVVRRRRAQPVGAEGVVELVGVPPVLQRRAGPEVGVEREGVGRRVHHEPVDLLAVQRGVKAAERRPPGPASQVNRLVMYAPAYAF